MRSSGLRCTHIFRFDIASIFDIQTPPGLFATKANPLRLLKESPKETKKAEKRKLLLAHKSRYISREAAYLRLWYRVRHGLAGKRGDEVFCGHRCHLVASFVGCRANVWKDETRWEISKWAFVR